MCIHKIRENMYIFWNLETGVSWILWILSSRPEDTATTCQVYAGEHKNCTGVALVAAAVADVVCTYICYMYVLTRHLCKTREVSGHGTHTAQRRGRQNAPSFSCRKRRCEGKRGERWARGERGQRCREHMQKDGRKRNKEKFQDNVGSGCVTTRSLYPKITHQPHAIPPFLHFFLAPAKPVLRINPHTLRVLSPRWV